METPRRTFAPQRRARRQFFSTHQLKARRKAGQTLLALAEKTEDPEIKDAFLTGAAALGFKPKKERKPAPVRVPAPEAPEPKKSPAQPKPTATKATPTAGMQEIISQNPAIAAELTEIAERLIPAMVRINQMRAAVKRSNENQPPP